MSVLYSPTGFENCILVSDRFYDAVADVSNFFPPSAFAEDGYDKYTAFPYTPRVAAALRDHGVPVKYPTKTARDFPLIVKGKREKPFNNQVVTTRFLLNVSTENPTSNAFVLNDAGTGKTLSVLWAWWYLRRVGAAGALCVLCPKSIVFSAWAKDIMASIPQAKVAYVVGDAKKRVPLCAPGYDIYVMNHDGIKHNDALFKNRTITHVAIDEASAFNDRRTTRFKMLRDFCKNKVVWAMTATPVSHSPDRAWALAQLVDRSRCEMSFSRFRDRVCREIKLGAIAKKFVPRPGAEQVVYETLQPAVRFKKSDCLDLPPLMYEDRMIGLSTEQKQFAAKLLKDWQWEEDHGMGATATVSADNAAIRLNKLLQCYQGAVLRDDKSVLYLNCTERIDELCALIDESEGKIIVATPFRAVNAMLSAKIAHAYRDQGGKDFVASITGSVSMNDRTQIVKHMQDPLHPLRVLLAHPETASHGLTLTEASTTVWYGPYFKSEFYAQMNERMNRPGQTRSMRIVHLISDKLEQQVFDLVKSRLATQDNILGLYKKLLRA